MKNTTQQTPVNFVTGKPYKGENAHIIQEAALAKGFTSLEWATANQWNSQGRSVAKGEKGTPITYKRKLDNDNGETVEKIETAYVFNRTQLMKA